MSEQVEKEPEGKANIQHIMLLIAAIVLPSSIWVAFGWASGLLPLIVFVFINKYGWRYTSFQLIIAVFAAGFLGVLLQCAEFVLFSVSMIPAGYVMAHSANHQEKPWLAGLKGWIVLGASLYIFFSVLLANSDLTLLQAITESLFKGIEEAQKQYRSSAGLSPENLVILEQTLGQVKSVAPLILPGLLGSMLLLVTWLTLVLGNSLLPAIGEAQPWESYRFWSLPDKLIWGLIVAGLAAMISEEHIRFFSINCLIVIVVLYSFQGLAIVAFLLNKWEVPRIVCTIIYVMIILQSFGTILLTAAGIADVWFDIRRLSPPKK